MENSSKKETLEKSVFFSLFSRRYAKTRCYVIHTFTATASTRTRMMIEDTHFAASGVFYAVLASIFFGSFAVPIKTKAIVKANVDPVAVMLFVAHLSLSL